LRPHWRKALLGASRDEHAALRCAARQDGLVFRLIGPLRLPRLIPGLCLRLYLLLAGVAASGATVTVLGTIGSIAASWAVTGTLASLPHLTPP
jgi:hypothetical protein